MNKYLCQWIDRVLLYRLHREKSKVLHFNNQLNEPPSLDLDHIHTFYPTPSIPDILFEQQGANGKYRVANYKFESEIKTGDHVNNFASGVCYELEPEQESQYAPVNVIFVHGWRMDNFDRIKRLFFNRFSKLSYNMYFFTMPYHQDRAPESSLYGGELMVSANVDRTLTAVRQAITDLRALIHWVKKNRGGKVVVIGLSLGGFITNLAGALEDQIDALISVLYANSIAYSVWHTVPGIHVKRDLEQHGFTYEELKRYWAITDPSHFKPKIPSRNILLISGAYDLFALKEDAEQVWEAWGKPRRILYPCGHAGMELYKKKIAEDVTSFIHAAL